jgi:hypothetical protein
MNTLHHWHKRGLIRSVDLALVETALHLDASTAESVLCALALCSRASADGHSALPLANLHDYLQQLQQTDLLDSDRAMLAQIADTQHQRFVQRGANLNAQALLQIEHDTIALRRRWPIGLRNKAGDASSLMLKIFQKQPQRCWIRMMEP